MSTEQKNAAPAPDELSQLEASLGQALVMIHRFLPRLDDTSHADEVQNGFRQILGCVTAAQAAHQKLVEARRPIHVGGQAKVDSEIVAVIAGAIAAVLGQPYRLVAVQPMPQPAPHLNVWALEGRTQIFQSHRIR